MTYYELTNNFSIVLFNDIFFFSVIKLIRELFNGLMLKENENFYDIDHIQFYHIVLWDMINLIKDIDIMTDILFDRNYKLLYITFRVTIK